jgi:hypothetical protein
LRKLKSVALQVE